jgi:hypothetical protein
VPRGAWELAAKVCCPAPEKPPAEPGEEGPLPLPYAVGLLDAPVYDTDLDRLLALLREPYRDELADLRERVARLESGARR